MSGTPPPRPGSTPTRPTLRRPSSQVRFHRDNKPSIGTLTSDTSTQGTDTTQVPSRTIDRSVPGASPYDINAYPSPTAPSGFASSYYNSEADDTEIEGQTPGQAPNRSMTEGGGDTGHRDSYTATPPRIATRRMSQTFPTVTDPIPSRGSQRFSTPPPPPIITASETISPRSTVPSEFHSPPSHYHHSPTPSPTSLPSAMKQTPPAPGQGYANPRYPGNTSPYMGAAAARPNAEYESPSRRMSEVMPRVGSPHTGYGSPTPGYRRYDEPQPPHSPRMYNPPPGAPPLPTYPSGEIRLSLSEWEEYQRTRQYDGRHDSDETLQGVEYAGKPDVPRKGTPISPRPSDTRYLAEPDTNGMRRRTTREVEGNDDESYRIKGGVFSQLLRMAGRSNTLRRRQISTGASSQGTAADLPTMTNLGLRSRASSTASTLFQGDEYEPDDPRVTGKTIKTKRPDWDDMAYEKTHDHGHKKRRASIQLHVADILTRQKFVMKLAKALMVFGAPSHRVESQLSATAQVLEIDAQFIHLPSIVIASFGDIDTRTSETHFIKASGGLDLGKLHRVHRIYRSVVHDELDAAEGTKQIHALLKAPSIYRVWHRICISFCSAGIACVLSFGGCLLDALAAGCLGVMLSFWQLHVASQSSMYSNIFEISIATVVSFVARGLSTTNIFCYQAVTSAGVTLILPGYIILCGSLELATKNIVSGSVRMVYAIIYSLFLGFGITIGSDMFFVFDKKAKNAQKAAVAASQNFITLTGSFVPLAINSSYAPGIDDSSPLVPFNGTFTFSNQTSSQVDSSLKAGHVTCDRPDGLPWYRQNMPRIYALGLVPIFSVLISLWNMQPLKSKQLPVMVGISCVGYLTNTLANRYIFDRSDVVSAIGAFVIGILGNVYSRVFGGTAFTSMVPGVLFLVPSGISAAGGLAMTNAQSHNDSYSQGLIIGFRMVQVAIGITVGVFGSGLLIYSFGRKKGSALFAF